MELKIGDIVEIKESYGHLKKGDIGKVIEISLPTKKITYSTLVCLLV